MLKYRSHGLDVPALELPQRLGQKRKSPSRCKCKGVKGFGVLLEAIVVKGANDYPGRWLV